MRTSARRTSSISSTASKTKELFRGIFARQGKGTWKKKWAFNQSSMFLDFLAGNQTFHCTPWGNPTRTYFGWQRPCYLLGEGYAKTFKELMETTDWDRYGTGNYEKCADCMVHSGYEATRGGRDGAQARGVPRRRCCAASAPRARWRRRSRWRTSARRNTCSAGTWSRR